MRLADNEILAWVARRRELIEWLAEAESRVRFGKVTVNYADGRIVSYEVYHRERTAAGNAVVERPANRRQDSGAEVLR